MPDGWSRPDDVELLAERRADIAFEIPLATLPRLSLAVRSSEESARVEGAARGRVKFGREGRFAVADIEVRASLPLICQRCLGTMQWPIDAQTRVVLVASGQEADELPAEMEAVIAAGNRVTVLELVEEELLLGVPVVPLHTELAECEPAGVILQEKILHEGDPAQPEDEVVQKPFADLGKLLKRDS